MLSTQISSKIEHFPFKKYFSGIFAIDKIPRVLKNYHFIVVNTDISSGPGKHWFCIVRLHNVIEIFDSLGLPDVNKQLFISHFNVRGISYISFNHTRLQPLTSSLCGEYVLNFLFERYHNLDLTFDDLVNECYSDQTKVNEDAIVLFIQKYLHEN